MTTQIHKTIKVKEYTEEDYEKDQSKKARRTQRIGVDFQKIEEAPVTQFEREVQEKIAVAPEARDLLIQEEERAILRKAIEEAGLPPSELTSLKLNLEGFEPSEISKRMGVSPTAVKSYLKRARLKIRNFIHTRYLREG